MSLIVYEHPLSPFAQKVKIALDEKGIAYECKTPTGMGSGQPDVAFLKANPRFEVPALIDDDVTVFDSSIILEYIEDKWPNPSLLPETPAERARARMIEDIMDTHFEPITWGLSEIRWFKRAQGELAEKLEAKAFEQLQGMYRWLERQLGSTPWLGGKSFGWADICAVPYINGAIRHGIAPKPGSSLADWLGRANLRPSVMKAKQDAMASLGSMPNVDEMIKSGAFTRQYRDHRLDWMIRSGGLSIVLDGIKNNNIRFSQEIS